MGGGKDITAALPLTISSRPTSSPMRLPRVSSKRKRKRKRKSEHGEGEDVRNLPSRLPPPPPPPPPLLNRDPRRRNAVTPP